VNRFSVGILIVNYLVAAMNLKAAMSWLLLRSVFSNVDAVKQPGVCLLQGSSRVATAASRIMSRIRNDGKVAGKNHHHSKPGKAVVFEPDHWNHDEAVLRSHNCYEYMLNDIDRQAAHNCVEMLKKKPSDTKIFKQCRRWFHIPGYQYHQHNLHEAVKFNKTTVTCKSMMARIASDGAGALLWSGRDKQPTTEYGPKSGQSWKHDDHCPDGSYMGALVVQPNRRFHFYRRDHECLEPENKGKRCWSHKPGILNATRFDSKGNEIFNLFKADRSYGKHSYTDVCGFFCVPSNKLHSTHSDFYRGGKKPDHWAIV